MQATYDNGNDDIRCDVLRDIPMVDASIFALQALMDGARDVSIRPEPCEEFGPATQNPPAIDRRDRRDWERIHWERRKDKDDKTGGRR